MAYKTANQFARVVMAEMRKKSMSLRNLAEESGISAGYLSLVLRGERNPPQPEVLDKMTVALGLKPPILHLLAGYVPKNDRRWDKLFARLRGMPDDQVDSVIDYIDSLLKKGKK